MFNSRHIPCKSVNSRPWSVRIFLEMLGLPRIEFLIWEATIALCFDEWKACAHLLKKSYPVRMYLFSSSIVSSAPMRSQARISQGPFGVSLSPCGAFRGRRFGFVTWHSWQVLMCFFTIVEIPGQKNFWFSWSIGFYAVFNRLLPCFPALRCTKRP